jgi:hypothetical protein
MKYSHTGDAEVQNFAGYVNLGADFKYDMFEVSPRMKFDFKKEYLGYTGSLKVKVQL